jgi:glycerol-3-phosphate dehydrogenase (NAD(P)+)
MSHNGAKVGVIGAGAWGTALAQVLSSNHSEVLLWAREDEVVARVNKSHENHIFLPGLQLSSRITATTNLGEMVDCSILLLVTPAQFLRATLMALPETEAALILCAKGLENGTLSLMTEIAAQLRPDNPLAVLSGPTFAHEVAAGKPR